jgi:hypothetical protein
MTVAVDATNVVSDSTSFTGTATSTSVTVGASDNLLLVAIGNIYNSSPAAVPDAVTYNGVSLTPLGNLGVFGNWDTALFYLLNPPTGTHTLAASWTTNTSGGVCCVTAIPISGAAGSSTFGTVATNSSATTSNPLVSPTGGVAGSLYLAATINGIATTTGSGSGQTDISASNGLGGGANSSFDVSTMAGSGSGAFTWTGSGALNAAQWVAAGVNINAAATTTAPIAWVT